MEPIATRTLEASSFCLQLRAQGDKAGEKADKREGASQSWVINTGIKKKTLFHNIEPPTWDLPILFPSLLWLPESLRKTAWFTYINKRKGLHRVSLWNNLTPNSSLFSPLAHLYLFISTLWFLPSGFKFAFYLIIYVCLCSHVVWNLSWNPLKSL